MSPLTNVMLTVAGTDRNVLRQAPGETTKQAALGGAIFTTAVVAALSSSLAFRMALHAPLWLAVIGGALWGIAILNLDRWLVVSSMRQRNVFWTLMQAVPRLLLALVIGLVVSTPLTLQIFNSEINAQLKVTQADALAAFEARMDSDPRFASLESERERIAEIQHSLATGTPADAVLAHPEVTELREQLAAVDEDFREAEKDVACEKEGTCGSGRAGVGPAAADKIARRDRLSAERSALQKQLDAKKVEVAASAERTAAQNATDLRAELAALTQRVEATEAERDREVAVHQMAVQNNTGLLARLGALHNLEVADPNLRTAHWTLFLFLTAFECLPVLFKTIFSLGRMSTYEWLQRKEEDRLRDRVLLRHEVEYDEAEILAESARNAARARAATQLDAEVRTARTVLQAQVDLATAAVDRWKQSEGDRLADDVSEWLRTRDATFTAGVDSSQEGAGR
jgi:hypothetical protein